MESLNKYKKIRDTKELLITIIVFNHTKDEFVNFLYHRLELIKKIKDSFKCKSNKSKHKHILEQYYEEGFKYGELLQKKITEKKSA